MQQPGTTTLAAELVDEFADYFQIEHQTTVNLVPFPEPLPDQDSFLRLIPDAFKMTSELSLLNNSSIRTFNAVKDISVDLAHYLQQQARKLDALTHYVLRSQDDAACRFFTFSYGGSGVQVWMDKTVALGQLYEVKLFLDNNDGAQSTDEPQLFLSATSLEEPYFLTADGYKWKYLYTISSDQKQKFLNDEWMPVVYNRFVRAAAINRAIDIIRITNSGNNYVDGPTQPIITIEGDGRNAALRANVINGQVSDIIIQNRGQDYTKANLIFTDIEGGIGTGASANVVLSPQNGHGYDPVEELYANTVMFNVDFEESENGVFPTENEFREVSVLYNPTIYDSNTLASGSLYKFYSQIFVSPGIGDFNNDEIIIQGDTLADATFTAEVISFDENTNIINVNNLNGTFRSNQPIKGLTSGAIRVGINKVPPTIQLYSGKTLFVTNKVPVVRDPDQTERIRFILSF